MRIGLEGLGLTIEIVGLGVLYFGVQDAYVDSASCVAFKLVVGRSLYITFKTYSEKKSFRTSEVH